VTKERLEPRELTPLIASKLTANEVELIAAARCRTEPERKRLRAYVEDQKMKYLSPLLKKEELKEPSKHEARVRVLVFHIHFICTPFMIMIMI
jgi:hypothetical protein